MILTKLTPTLAGAAGLALIASPALAVPCTVTVTGNPSGDYTMTATAAGSTVLTVSGGSVTCASSTFDAVVHADASTTGNGVVEVDPAVYGTLPPRFSGCTFGSFPATVSVSNPHWDFNVTGGNTSGTTDVVTGTLTNLSAVHVAVTGPLGNCAFDVGGSLGGTFTETTQQLDVTGSSLTVSNLSSPLGCLGLVTNGGAASLAASYGTSVAGVSAPAINIS